MSKVLKFVNPKIKLIEPIIVVGNSPSILKKKGKTIDRFKTVIRFNDYKVKKYVNYTGKKTNICFISNSNYKKIIPTKKFQRF